jgi:hypothetical protein
MRDLCPKYKSQVSRRGPDLVTLRATWMRSLTLLFRRDPSRDRQDEKVRFEGYRAYWPDGRPVAVSLDAFCTHGQRLLGLGRHLAGCREKLVTMLYLPLQDRDSDIHRIPGHRVRRFYLERQGSTGRIHFLDGTPTTAVFDLNCDEPKILQWLGLSAVEDGSCAWFDLAAVGVEAKHKLCV